MPNHLIICDGCHWQINKFVAHQEEDHDKQTLVCPVCTKVLGTLEPI